jgi:hypothetical protein
MNRCLQAVCAAMVGAMVFGASAQNSPPEPAPKPAKPTFPTPGGNPTSDEPVLTTNARAQANAEHKAARAKCEKGPMSQRDDCLRQADEHYDRALAGENPGEQGNPGSNTGFKGTGLN